MSNYSNGRSYEYRTMRLLEKENYACFRSAGSHTCVDIIAVLPANAKNIEDKPVFRFIQVKSGSSPYKKDLLKLSQSNLPASIQKELWVYKPRQEIRKIIIP